MKVTKNKFEKWGETYGKGDVVGCYFSVGNDGRVKVGWTKNGKDIGIGFDEVVEKDKLKVRMDTNIRLVEGDDSSVAVHLNVAVHLKRNLC